MSLSFKLTLALFALIGLGLAAMQYFKKPERWVVYYANKLPPEALAGYDLLVLDSDINPPLASFIAQNKELLGYISLGEADPHRSYYEKLKPWLLPKHPKWSDRELIDVRRPEFQQFVVEELVPSIMAKGFTGIMIDTVDSSIQIEQDEPVRAAGMSDAAAQLIKAIHSRHPDLRIMLNRGFAILPKVARDIDMVMAESIYAGWNAAAPGQASPVSNEHYQQYLTLLRGEKNNAPDLKIYSLDYWPPGDEKSIKNIYRKQRSEGFIAYVAADPGLQSITAEPR